MGLDGAVSGEAFNGDVECMNICTHIVVTMNEAIQLIRTPFCAQKGMHMLPLHVHMLTLGVAGVPLGLKENLSNAGT